MTTQPPAQLTFAAPLSAKSYGGETPLHILHLAIRALIAEATAEVFGAEGRRVAQWQLGTARIVATEVPDDRCCYVSVAAVDRRSAHALALALRARVPLVALLVIPPTIANQQALAA